MKQNDPAVQKEKPDQWSRLQKSKGKMPARSEQSSTGTSVVWAIDPEESDLGYFQKSLDLVRLFAGDDKKILPLSVLSPIDLDWPMDIPRQRRQILLLSARSKSESVFSRLATRIGSAEIVVSPTLSLLSSVKKMLSYVKRKKADLIVLYSRQSDEKRLTGFGSFSELTITLATIPVVIIGQNTKVPLKISRILVPTDFGASRKKSIRAAIEWSRRLNAELILFHQLGTPLAPVAFTSFGAPMDAAWLADAMMAQQESERQTAKQWQAEAQKRGVRCRLLLEMGDSNWSQRSLELAKKHKADLVLISHRRGVWGQTLFGGQIRKMFAKATCPLMLLHSS